jgi:hypothetical protein
MFILPLGIRKSIFYSPKVAIKWMLQFFLMRKTSLKKGKVLHDCEVAGTL